MDTLDVHDNPLVSRYAGPAMAELWSPRRKFTTWRKLWIALAEAEAELGLLADDGATPRITPAMLAEMRAHVDDIAEISRLVLTRDFKGQIWNVADDEPAPPQDVIAYAAALLGLKPPPEEPFEGAALSEMSRSFYEDNRRIRIDKLKRELGFRPLYPTYREGLRALAQAGEGRGVTWRDPLLGK